MIANPAASGVSNIFTLRGRDVPAVATSKDSRTREKEGSYRPVQESPAGCSAHATGNRQPSSPSRRRNHSTAS